MKIASLLCATTALVLPSMAFAQSTGSVDFEADEIVVTGTRAQDVGGIKIPDTPKAKQVLTQEVIARANPGQTVLDTINQIPGVSFQNNDAYGSSGGTLSIRGFTSDRISLTFDGVPLNDSGNYAIYSNQQLDPEVIQEVNVNLGTTDVDSPTASAVGGTVNYRTRVPGEELGGMVSASYGEFDFHRVFGMLDTGAFTPWGTRAFVSASKATNDNPFNNYGKVNKQQYNGRIYQPFGANGDFVSIAGHYNQNRNNFFGSLPLRNDRPVPAGYPQSNDDREYDIFYPCTIDTPQAGVTDSRNGCGVEFDRRYNPSNTGNIRGASRFSLTEALTLTVDPSFQYVKANGGGTVLGREGVRVIGGQPFTGFIGGQYYFGRDLNGDGDTLDTCSATGASCSSSNLNGVTLIAPSQTRTRRYGVISNLMWEINEQNNVRLSYTYDDANHRQTGQVGFVRPNGEPVDVFPINDPITDASGTVVQKRDRQSYATLHQVAGEYRGEFLDEALTVNLGLRAPFFKRDLENYCFTTSASGFVDCFGTNQQLTAQYAALNPNRQGPQRRVLKYDKLLPNVGAVYHFTPQVSAFASYAKGLSVPGTDALYDSFFFAPDTAQARPAPETTDTFDGGVRYRSSRVQAQLGAWYTMYQNRLASAYDPDLDTTVFRNLGDVDKYGVDGSVSYQPNRNLLLYVFGSWNKSEIKDDLLVGECTTRQVTDGFPGCSVVGTPILAPTAGKREAGSPNYTYGGTVRGTLGPVELGVTAKRTGSRYIFDTNEPVLSGRVTESPVEIYPEKAPAYWLVNLDARYSLADMGLEKTYLQLNVYNLFDKFYVGGFGGGLNQSVNTAGFYGNPPFVQIGAPRTISGTLVVGF